MTSHETVDQASPAHIALNLVDVKICQSLMNLSLAFNMNMNPCF